MGGGGCGVDVTTIGTVVGVAVGVMDGSGVGGSGGLGGTGDSVFVDNGGSILTSGHTAYGIKAQSVGGGGGDGGWSFTGAFGAGDSKNLSVAIGGSGGAGGPSPAGPDSGGDAGSDGAAGDLGSF